MKNILKKYKLSPKYETTTNIDDNIEYKKIKPELICNINSTSNCTICIHKKCFTI
jgi:hypothetical protein